MKRFGETLEGLSPAALNGFYAENFIDLMGEGLAPELPHPLTGVLQLAATTLMPITSTAGRVTAGASSRAPR